MRAAAEADAELNTKDIARGGLLAAAAVALLYIGAAASYIGVAACLVAGVTSAVPLLRRARLKTAVMLYMAVSLLALLLVPRKVVAFGYILLTGLYPIIKYLIEARLPLRLQTGVKLVYCNVVLAVAGVLASRGFFPQIEVPAFWKLAGLWFAANIAFIVYDIGLSRLIAVLRRTLPPD